MERWEERKLRGRSWRARLLGVRFSSNDDDDFIFAWRTHDRRERSRFWERNGEMFQQQHAVATRAWMTNKKCIQGKLNKIKSRDKVVLLLCDNIVRRYVVLQTKYKVRWTIVLIHSAYESWVCHHFCLFVFCCMLVPVMGLLLHCFIPSFRSLSGNIITIICSLWHLS